MTKKITATVGRSEASENVVEVKFSGATVEHRDGIALAYRVAARANELAHLRDCPIYVGIGNGGIPNVVADLTYFSPYSAVADILRRAALDCGVQVQRPSVGGGK